MRGLINAILANRCGRIALQWGGVAVIAGVILGLLGPFGSYQNSGFGLRIVYWICAMLLGAAVFGGCLALIQTRPFKSRLVKLLSLALLLLVASLLQAFITRTAAFWLWPELLRINLSPWLWYCQTLIIGLVMFGVVVAFQYRKAPLPDRKPTPTTSAFTLPADVLALQMEDHYVRVHTVSGAQLVLMPLHEAIARLEGEGLRVHRSWWVARRAVLTIEGSPRAMRLHLKNGLVAPVARSAVATLRQAGWLATSEHASL